MATWTDPAFVPSREETKWGWGEFLASPEKQVTVKSPIILGWRRRFRVFFGGNAQAHDPGV